MNSRKQIIELSLYVPRQQLLTANRMGHWAPRSRKIRNLREIACWHAIGSRVNVWDIAYPSRVVITYGWTGPGRVRDAANLAPTSKALVDGLVDAQLFPDDNGAYVIGPDNRFGDPSDRPGLVKITIRIEDPA